MKNTLKMLLAGALVCTLAHAEDYSEKIRQTKEECDKILDDMFFVDFSKTGSCDFSIEGDVRRAKKIEDGPVETTGWWIVKRREDIKRRIKELKNPEAENEVLKFVEMRIEENTKKLIPLIPYNASDTIGMNYDQLVGMPGRLCRNGLRSQESDCRQIHKKMWKFADEIIDHRRETECPEK